jgi:hypothetical protein
MCRDKHRLLRRGVHADSIEEFIKLWLEKWLHPSDHARSISVESPFNVRPETEIERRVSAALCDLD